MLKNGCAGLVGLLFGHSFDLVKVENQKFKTLDLNEMAWPDLQPMLENLNEKALLKCKRCGLIKIWKI